MALLRPFSKHHTCCSGMAHRRPWPIQDVSLKASAKANSSPRLACASPNARIGRERFAALIRRVCHYFIFPGSHVDTLSPPDALTVVTATTAIWWPSLWRELCGILGDEAIRAPIRWSWSQSSWPPWFCRDSKKSGRFGLFPRRENYDVASPDLSRQKNGWPPSP